MLPTLSCGAHYALSTRKSRTRADVVVDRVTVSPLVRSRHFAHLARAQKRRKCPNLGCGQRGADGASGHLMTLEELWRAKTDDELATAARELLKYSDQAEEGIREELRRRGISEPPQTRRPASIGNGAKRSAAAPRRLLDDAALPSVRLWRLFVVVLLVTMAAADLTALLKVWVVILASPPSFPWFPSPTVTFSAKALRIMSVSLAAAGISAALLVAFTRSHLRLRFVEVYAIVHLVAVAIPPFIDSFHISFIEQFPYYLSDFGLHGRLLQALDDDPINQQLGHPLKFWIGGIIMTRALMAFFVCSISLSSVSRASRGNHPLPEYSTRPSRFVRFIGGTMLGGGWVVFAITLPQMTSPLVPGILNYVFFASGVLALLHARVGLGFLLGERRALYWQALLLLASVGSASWNTLVGVWVPLDIIAALVSWFNAGQFVYVLRWSRPSSVLLPSDPPVTNCRP